jgi:hypothetical protein
MPTQAPFPRWVRWLNRGLRLFFDVLLGLCILGILALVVRDILTYGLW